MTTANKPRKGEPVIILPTDETEALGIVGQSGAVEWTDSLGYVGVRVAGYPQPFALRAGDVRRQAKEATNERK